MIKKGKAIPKKIIDVQDSPIIEPKQNEFNLRPVKSRQVSRLTSEGSVLTIISTMDNGNRISIAEEVIETIGSSLKVQVAIYDDGVAISRNIPNTNNHFNLRKNGKKFVIYSKELVNEISETFELDFSNRSSISFQEESFANR